MLTLLGSLLGFLSSGLPELVKFFTARADRAHELAVMDRQMEMRKLTGAQRLEEIQVQADGVEAEALYRSAGPTGAGWVDALAGTVRPVITYAFFALFAAVKGSAIVVLASGGATLHQALLQVWDSETQALFAAVMSFWFGARALAKARMGR